MQNIFTWAVLYYLRFFARLALFINRPTIIGITGSAGKSSTRNLIYAVLKDYFPTKTIEKGNSETGIPLGVLGLKVESLGFGTPIKSIFDWLRLMLFAPFGIFYIRGIKYLVVEMGVDDPYPPKNMEYLLTIVNPEICVFLNVYPVHTMQFEKVIRHVLLTKTITKKEKLNLLLSAIAQEKGKLITENENCKVAIYNADNTFVRTTVVSGTYKKKTFGKDFGNDISYESHTIRGYGTDFSFRMKNRKNGKIMVKLPGYLLPKAYSQSIAASVLVGKQVGLTPSQITKGITKNFSLPKGRSGLLEGIRNSVIIDSSYNASKAPVLEFLTLLTDLKKQEKKSAVFVFGDMRELGDESEHEHEKVAEEIFKTADYLYCVGPLTKEYIIENSKFKIQNSKLKDVRWFEDSVTAGKYLKENLSEASIVLVKGSQNTIFLEEAIKFILKNKKDQEKLCRQEDFWMKKKKYLYES